MSLDDVAFTLDEYEPLIARPSRTFDFPATSNALPENPLPSPATRLPYDKVTDAGDPGHETTEYQSSTIRFLRFGPGSTIETDMLTSVSNMAVCPPHFKANR
jgi:hypothetical protein